MPKFRTAVAGVAAAAGVAAPLAIATSADAVGRPSGPVIRLDVDWYGVAFSPNGDHVKDRGRIGFTLGARSDVIVKIRRHDKARTLVFKDRLTRLGRGDHTWTWTGKNRNGKRVGDGHYFAVVVAGQPAADGKKRSVTADVYLDTAFDVPWAPKLTGDTVYPRTPGYPTDSVAGSLGSSADDPMTALGLVRETFEDDQGREVRKPLVFDYHPDDGYGYASPLSVNGIDQYDDPLPAGDYRLGFRVRDLAGNPGGDKSVTVHISDKPLVLASGSVVVPPTTPPAPARTSRRGGDDVPPVPCGTVVPSEVYADPGAMSFRSSDACADWGRPHIATAAGGFDLGTAVSSAQAPRGLFTAWVSMRGKPTVAGETDTAYLTMSGGTSTGSPGVTSAATPEESVTTTGPMSFPFEAPYYTDYFRTFYWSITTKGTDSYDVAAVTVNFTYLTPQP